MFKLINEEKYKEVAKELDYQLKDAPEFDFEARCDVYDFIGTLAANGWGGVLYEVIRRFSGLPADEGFEMDRFILEKHCMMDGEKIGASFFADIKIDNMFMNEARVHISGERIVIVGEKRATPSGGNIALSGYVLAKIAAFESLGYIIPKLDELGTKLGKAYYGFHLPFEGCTFQPKLRYWIYRHTDIPFAIRIQPVLGPGQKGTPIPMLREMVEDALVYVYKLRKSAGATSPAASSPNAANQILPPTSRPLDQDLDGSSIDSISCLACGGEVSSGICFSCMRRS